MWMYISYECAKGFSPFMMPRGGSHANADSTTTNLAVHCAVPDSGGGDTAARLFGRLLTSANSGGTHE